MMMIKQFDAMKLGERESIGLHLGLLRCTRSRAEIHNQLVIEDSVNGSRSGFCPAPFYSSNRTYKSEELTYDLQRVIR
jgi:hypothetical protein